MIFILYSAVLWYLLSNYFFKLHPLFSLQINDKNGNEVFIIIVNRDCCKCDILFPISVSHSKYEIGKFISQCFESKLSNTIRYRILKSTIKKYSISNMILLILTYFIFNLSDYNYIHFFYLCFIIISISIYYIYTYFKIISLFNKELLKNKIKTSLI